MGLKRWTAGPARSVLWGVAVVGLPLLAFVPLVELDFWRLYPGLMAGLLGVEALRLALVAVLLPWAWGRVQAGAGVGRRWPWGLLPLLLALQAGLWWASQPWALYVVGRINEADLVRAFDPVQMMQSLMEARTPSAAAMVFNLHWGPPWALACTLLALRAAARGWGRPLLAGAAALLLLAAALGYHAALRVAGLA